MRVTNSMLNNTSAKSGIALNESSLLNYIDNDSSDDELLASLQRGKTEKNKEKKVGFEKLEEASEQLAQKALQFFMQGEGSLFEKAKESGNYEQVWEKAEALVNDFNKLLKELGTTSTQLEDYYKKMLVESAGGSAEALAQIGITQQKDGTLKLDKEKLKAADPETLEKVLGKDGGFSARVTLIAGRIAANAQANVESLSSRYDASGNSWSAAMNKYDFWG